MVNVQIPRHYKMRSLGVVQSSFSEYHLRVLEVVYYKNFETSDIEMNTRACYRVSMSIRAYQVLVP